MGLPNVGGKPVVVAAFGVACCLFDAWNIESTATSKSVATRLPILLP